MNRRVLAVAAAAILVSCTPTSRAIIEQAVENVKVSENAKARLALQAPCAMTVGAKNRVLSEDEKRHAAATPSARSRSKIYGVSSPPRVKTTRVRRVSD